MAFVILLKGSPLPQNWYELLQPSLHRLLQRSSRLSGQSLHWLGFGWWRLLGNDNCVTCQIAFLSFPWPPLSLIGLKMTVSQKTQQPPSHLPFANLSLVVQGDVCRSCFATAIILVPAKMHIFLENNKFYLACLAFSNSITNFSMLAFKLASIISLSSLLSNCSPSDMVDHQLDLTDMAELDLSSRNTFYSSGKSWTFNTYFKPSFSNIFIT